MDIFATIKKANDPYIVYKQMRLEQPIVYDHEYQLWSVFTYDEVKQVLSNHEHFSSNFNAHYPAYQGANPLEKHIFSSDPPLHNQLRSLIAKAFTPRGISHMETAITQTVSQLIKQIADKGQLELIQDFAIPLPIITIAHMLGMLEHDLPLFQEWARGLLRHEQAKLHDEAANELKILNAQMLDYFKTLIKLRSSKPGADVLSLLMQSTVAGEPLTEKDLLSFCQVLLLAGHIAVIKLLGNSVATLLTFPEVRENITQDPAKITPFLEEVLRYRTPVQMVPRVTTAEVVLDGQVISKGERIIAWLGSANRDEAKFTAPDVFNLHRQPNPHLAFGHGVHFCLGSPLARLQAKIGLLHLLKAFPEMALVDAAELQLYYQLFPFSQDFLVNSIEVTDNLVLYGPPKLAIKLVNKNTQYV